MSVSIMWKTKHRKKTLVSKAGNEDDNDDEQ